MHVQTAPLVTLAGAGISRDGRWLVRGVDLSVARGEIVTLIGPNGAGKSTTAKMALGLLKPDEGSASRQPDLKVGYVPQKLAIDWTLPLTVGRFLCLTRALTPLAIGEALTDVGIAHLAEVEVRTLSGGEFQRAMLARAIALKPDLLVLDEPVQGVDFNGELELYQLIKRIRDQHGCGILLISHDLHVVMAATDKVVCLNGHVCCSGAPGAVAENIEFKRLFGGHAAATLAVYQHDHDHRHLADGRVLHADGSITADCHSHDSHAHEHDHGRGRNQAHDAERPATGERHGQDVQSTHSLDQKHAR